METVVANVAGKARRAVRNGRGYLVCGATLITEGVLNGSRGPGLYLAEELARHPAAWDDLPVVVQHPVVNGAQVSGRRPDVLDKHKVGRNYETAFSDRLVANLWFDEEAVRRVEPALLGRLERGEKVELSTGLNLRHEPAPEGATHNGQPYSWVARDLRPDHVAILPDREGACSVKDGCGVNNAEGEAPYGHCPQCGAPGVSRERRPGGNDACANGHAYPSASAVGKPAMNAEQRTVWQRLKQLVGLDGRAETIDTTGPATPAANAGRQNMDREAAITYLVTNCDCWKHEGDREVLNKLPDANLQRLEDAAKKDRAKGQPPPPAPPVGNQAPAAARLTPEQEEDLAFARAERARQKQTMIDRLTANTADPAMKAAKAAVYAAMKSDQLAHLMADLPPEPHYGPPGAPVANWLGAAGAHRAGGKDDSQNLLPAFALNERGEVVPA
jgi:hypothetical protein